MAEQDDTVGYFKGLGTKTEPIRQAFDKAKVEVKPAPEAKPAMAIDEDDAKYMSKQAAKIGDRLTKAAQKRYTKQMPKR